MVKIIAQVAAEEELCNESQAELCIDGGIRSHALSPWKVSALE